MTGIMKPADIERRSMEIIEEHLAGRSFAPDTKDIIKRVIHTTADFDYADTMTFSENAVKAAHKALLNGADIVTDTNMAYSGINKKVLGSLGGKAHCFMADADVADEAKRRGITRAAVSMERACRIDKPLIIAVGNAPTALIRLAELIKDGRINPVIVIGVPVGFVNVVEAKEIIMKSGAEYIVARGNKGGSNVAAAICNALLYKIKR